MSDEEEAALTKVIAHDIVNLDKVQDLVEKQLILHISGVGNIFGEE